MLLTKIGLRRVFAYRSAASVVPDGRATNRTVPVDLSDDQEMKIGITIYPIKE